MDEGTMPETGERTLETSAPGVLGADPDATVIASRPPVPPAAAVPPAPPALPTAPAEPPPDEPDTPPLGVPTTVSSYLAHLPGIYRENLFLGRFLLIFEHILAPVERTVANIPHYFNPYLTPPECLDWLADWLGLIWDDSWPEHARRELIARAGELYEWRGTRRGLREFLKIYTGVEPEIVQATVSEVAANRSLAFRFAIRVTLPPGSPATDRAIEQIVEMEKPAFAAYSLEIIRS